MLRGRAAWVHDYNPGSRIQAAFQTLPGASFTVDGAAAPRDAALTSAVAELRLHQRLDADRQGRRRVLQPLAHPRRHRDAPLRVVDAITPLHTSLPQCSIVLAPARAHIYAHAPIHSAPIACRLPPGSRLPLGRRR